MHIGEFHLSVVCIHLSVRRRAHRGVHLNVTSFNFPAVLVATDHDLRFISIETDRQSGTQASRIQRFAMTSLISGSASPDTCLESCRFAQKLSGPAAGCRPSGLTGGWATQVGGCTGAPAHTFRIITFFDVHVLCFFHIVVC